MADSEKWKCDTLESWSMINHALLPIDQIDLQILCCLKLETRTTNSEIAELLNMSEATVRRRIKELQDRKIILGFSAMVNVLAIENSIKTFIKVEAFKSSPWIGS